MNKRMLCLTVLTCMIGHQAVFSAEGGGALILGEPAIQPGDVGKTTVPVSSKDGPLPLAIRWWGHACVSIETFWGFTIVVDPYPHMDRLGYPKLDLTADLVLVTHEHSDHTAVEAIQGRPVVLRGLTRDGDWAKIDHYLDRRPNQSTPSVLTRANVDKRSPHAVHIRGIKTFHDDRSGAKRGKNVLMLIEADGVRMLHCGDLGHALTDEQLKAIGPIDLLLVPVGGTYTLDAAGALRVSQQLKPRRWIWPIHFNIGAGRSRLTKVDAFLGGAKQAGMAVRKVKGHAVAIARGDPNPARKAASPGVIASDWKPVRLKPEIERALAAMRADRRALVDKLGKVSKTQLDHKPSNGTHTLRWNFEHTTGRELGFYSQVYHALDAEVPVINWNPAQMPPDFGPRHPEWDTDEMVRHVERVGAFTERFSYLLADVPAKMKIEGTRFSIRSLSRLMVGHYRNHTRKSVRKFTLPDWPKR